MLSYDVFNPNAEVLNLCIKMKWNLCIEIHKLGFQNSTLACGKTKLSLLISCFFVLSPADTEIKESVFSVLSTLMESHQKHD